MTSRQEITTPVVANPLADGFVTLKVATNEALEVLNLEPVPTTWKSDTGRPIYFRLPAISQQYQKGYDRDQAFVYIEPKFGKPFAAGSLQVGRFDERRNVLFVESGEITWDKGQINVSSFEVDTSTLNFGLGLPDGLYQVGYTLEYTKPTDGSPIPGYSIANVEDSLLSEASVGYAASSSSENHEAHRALSFEGAWWPGISTDANGETYTLDLQQMLFTDKFVLVGDTREVSTALLTVEYSTDSSTWTILSEVRPIDGRWEVPIYRNFKSRYWRFGFTDGDASIEEILYTGEAYFPDNRVSGSVQVATPYIDNFYEEVPGNYLLLASFELKRGLIDTVVDYRRIDTFRYEPVSDWTTDFQDSALMCLFNDVENYATKFLAPPTADFHLYGEMDTSVCYGLGEFDVIGEKVDA